MKVGLILVDINEVVIAIKKDEKITVIKTIQNYNKKDLWPFFKHINTIVEENFKGCDVISMGGPDSVKDTLKPRLPRYVKNKIKRVYHVYNVSVKDLDGLLGRF